ncbi:cell surface glycoprotein CD200 receptor 1 isoform X1 [Cebus imitator]|uniref:cell surface glycoprotein CD200 receptor 1 isoform X1 n=1 Tax=Cebus imitator TaxID=2715852 RepID=UPI000809C5BA|nr:cell surface glycoprotein CD200 receptor 1 isoform X1 [Cebus imitator]
MLCPWRTANLGLLLILTVFLVTECIHSEAEGAARPNNSLILQNSKENLTLDFLASSSSCMDGTQITQNNSAFPTEVNISWPILMGKNAVLCCPITLKYLIITWEIILKDQPSCKKAYKKETNETKETNCTDERITWVSRPDQNLDLQIRPVAITHDGYYRCIMGAPGGNFYHGYHLEVLVTPEVTLFQSRNGTVVCKAVAGKPAAQISWIPEGDCVTEQKCWNNGTVTVKSACHWEGHNVSTVTCRVSHLTGNRSLDIELLPVAGAKKSAKLYIPYIILAIILIIVGFIFLLKISGCRKYKWNKTEATPVVEEDEMQPYASYTEKNNPLYDTTNKVKVSQALQSEAGTSLHAL